VVTLSGIGGDDEALAAPIGFRRMSDLKLGAGIDIGGRRKGFHVAAVTGAEVVAGPQGIPTGDHIVQVLKKLNPVVIALDSPRSCSSPGENSRQGERDLNREICGIRWTPEEAKLAGNPYYEWIVCGRELYDALERERGRRGWEVIEVFPTASWTIWAGRRGKKHRARWTREALDDMKLDGLPSRRLNQDDRDAIAAALTAKLHAEGRTRPFGDIVVPVDEQPP
jgi:predicted nuclease with RNAse H fold